MVSAVGSNPGPAQPRQHDIRLRPPDPELGHHLPRRRPPPPLSRLLTNPIGAQASDLSRRGFDVVVLELTADPLLPGPVTPAQRLARRLWLLEREAVRHQLSAVGVSCARWDEGQPLGGVVEQLSRRRDGRPAWSGRAAAG